MHRFVELSMNGQVRKPALLKEECREGKNNIITFNRGSAEALQGGREELQSFHLNPGAGGRHDLFQQHCVSSVAQLAVWFLSRYCSPTQPRKTKNAAMHRFEVPKELLAFVFQSSLVPACGWGGGGGGGGYICTLASPLCVSGNSPVRRCSAVANEFRP